MSLDVKTIRQRVATAIDAVTGYSEAKQPHGLFGRDPTSVLHQRFSVGTPRTTTVSSRQRLSDGALVRTEVVVTFSHRVKPKDQITSYDAILDAEADVVHAVMADTSGTLDELQLSYEGTPSRAVDPAGEWALVELLFSSLHTLAMS